ncbi:sugar ABC transporter substrate-binding protein [Streptomyces sp. DSM 44915]|uniref:Sugar ABC transporter substrate-binding protein n=1 Tax=Streptomyces chisholmiae TaxID=3075540 RepID=A0ABU2JZ14_9ACTN|nr:sugar ABC transporter substrate-binding protein [Streptomyces sp. DSM 44915]MDT0269764.1 sugar ABC transporter substrate-binding protein [Streptomyces sp. DSM 44915]
MTKTARRALRGVGLATVVALGLTACGSDDGGSGEAGASADEVAQALEEGGEITVWAWEPTLGQTVEDFEAEYPNVTVNLVNAGTANDQYTALQNAMQAGSGVPDVAQIEYYAMGQFSLNESVTELSGFGANDLADTFSPGPWSAVQANDGVYGLPMDSGPMALFYNKDLFDEHGIEVPTTWDEYLQAARDLHEADPSAYMTNDTGDAGFATSMIWQAGGRPYQVEGTEIGIDLADEGSTRYTELWQQMLDEDLLAPITSWSDEWFQGMGDGTIASLATGAWMPANLESSLPDGAGSWRVAPLPQWEEGDTASAENGGSALTIPDASSKKALAYGFLEYVNVGDGVQTRLSNGAFPATTADLASEDFLSTEFDYFGGQQANQVFAESAANVADDWSYLPFQVYANSIFNDSVGKAYVSNTRLADGFAGWQEASRSYGEEQGFTITD